MTAILSPRTRPSDARPPRKRSTSRLKSAYVENDQVPPFFVPKSLLFGYALVAWWKMSTRVSNLVALDMAREGYPTCTIPQGRRVSQMRARNAGAVEPSGGC